jgi:hypothetical protein
MHTIVNGVNPVLNYQIPKVGLEERPGERIEMGEI